MKKCFTLSEVLIALTIIGIVSAITVPQLIQSHQNRTVVVKLKRAYSILEQAYLRAKLTYGEPDTWGIGARDNSNTDDEDYTAENAKLIQDRLFSGLATVKICEKTNDKSACNIPDAYYYLTGSKDNAVINQTVAAVTNDGGTFIVIVSTAANCASVRGSGQFLRNVCALIYYDINGAKKPNTYGKDFFVFYLTKNGIIPVGTPEETSWPFSRTEAVGRAAWVIYNENLDYLDCFNQLGWDKKRNCKG